MLILSRAWSKRYSLLMLVAVLLSGCSNNSSRRILNTPSHCEDSENIDTSTPTLYDQTRDNIDLKAKALLNVYPDFISDISDNRVFFKDGGSIEFDDKQEKDFVQRLDNSDVEDMFFDVYTVTESAPDYQADAGRSRSELLFKKMYGNSEKEVRSHLTQVLWNGSNVMFTSVNGASDSLRAVAKELENYPELSKYLNSSGTFYWRKVRGANRMSAHSYGIAFDIAIEYADYWQWSAKSNDEKIKVKYQNRIPKELVEIFERHGFIWGGSWYHYDTMHFEFRPEILEYARLINLKTT